MKKKICIIITILILVIFVFLVFFMSGNQFSMTINDSKIDKEEFLAAASQRRYEVTSYFSGKSGGNVDSDFWEREIEGEVPYQKLAEAAIEELKYFHAVYSLAAEKGYIENDDYSSFLERWESENKIRKEKIEKGEAVYGLSEYTLDLYKEYEMDTLQKRYCEDLENEGMNITDDDRMQYYEEHKAYYNQEDDRILDYIQIPYEEENISEDQVQELKESLTSVYKQMDQDHSISALAEEDENLSSYFMHADVTAAELSFYAKTDSDILEYAWDLGEGESTAVLDENGCLYLIECTKRKANDAIPMDEIKDNINKTLREERYNEIIAERALHASVECDMEQVYSFIKKHVNN